MHDKDLLLLVQALAPVVARHIKHALDPLALRIAEIEKRIGAELPALIELRRDLENHLGEAIDGLPVQIEKLVDAAISGEADTVCRIARTEIASYDKDKGLCPTELVSSVVAAEVARQIETQPKPKDGQDGKSVDPETVKAMVAEEVGRQVSALPPAKDGTSVIADDVRPMVEAAVAKAVAALPPAKDGRDADPEAIKVAVLKELPAPKEIDRDALAALVTGEIAKAVSALPPAKDGKDADPAIVADLVAKAVAEIPPAQDGASVTLDDVRPLIAEGIADAMKAIPKAADGKSVTLDELRPVVDETVARAIEKIPAAKDGIGAAGALIDRDGELSLTMTDGRVVKLGRVTGKDGEPGLGFDDLDVVHDGGRGFKFRLVRGETVKEFAFTLPVVLDRGVFKDGTAYEPGDGVTFGGSLWIAQRATGTKPGTDDSWRLAVKKGRDGKDGEAPKPPAVVKLR